MTSFEAMKERFHARWPIFVIWLLPVTLLFIAIGGLYNVVVLPDQALNITACTPETYFEGATQSDCAHPKAPPDDVHNVTDSIRVLGQVCNNSDEPIAYTVIVEWVSVETAASFRVIDVPIVYDPGCQAAYDVEWTAPDPLREFLNANGDSGESLGQWRIIGQAIPEDPDSYKLYNWDSVKTFELIDR